MLWNCIRNKVKSNFYPDLLLLSQHIPRIIRTSVYHKYGLNIRFEVVPEWLPPMLYYWHFGKYKGYHYPTDDNIKYFYFTLFKKNGFIFILFCCILYRNCFIEFIVLVTKSGIAFYLIVYFIYMVLFFKKHIRKFIKTIYRTPIKLLPTLTIIFINHNILNTLFNNSKKKKKWYF